MAADRKGMRVPDAAPGQSRTADRSFECEAGADEVEDWKTKRPWIASAERWSTHAQSKQQPNWKMATDPINDPA